jgi:hypothetical protein
VMYEAARSVPPYWTASFVSGAPHLPQKSDVGGFSALHFAQCLASANPHFAQKLLVEGLFVPHFEQRIGAPTLTQRHIGGRKLALEPLPPRYALTRGLEPGATRLLYGYFQAAVGSALTISSSG